MGPSFPRSYNQLPVIYVSESDCILHSTIKESEGVTVAVILDVVRSRHMCREAKEGWERFGCDSVIAVKSACRAQVGS